MKSEERREEILTRLQESNSTIKGTDLANIFKVSRQIIVQDVAILRAQGFHIIATPQGYVIPKKDKNKLIKTLALKHKTYEGMQEELQIMIDHGAKVIDVIVEHPVYGEIRGLLDIGYKKELDEFMDKVTKENAEPLSSLTEGIHIHTIEVPDEDSYEKMKLDLIKKNYLVKE